MGRKVFFSVVWKRQCKLKSFFMYDVFNVVMICSLDETYWFTCLWNYLLMKRIVGQTGTEVVMSVITMESKQLLYSEANIGNSLYIFSWCALNDIK